MLFIGYLFGIRSERQLVKETEVNIAYRWFLGFSLTHQIPSYLTISQNRIRRFKDTTIYQDIFDNIVFQAINKKLVDGKILYTDSTHLKANANKNKFTKEEVTQSTKNYFKELEKDIDKDRINHDKKPLKKRKNRENYCPDLRALEYRTTNRQGYREYICKEEFCSNCSKKEKCLSDKSLYFSAFAALKKFYMHINHNYIILLVYFSYKAYMKSIHNIDF